MSKEQEAALTSLLSSGNNAAVMEMFNKLVRTHAIQLRAAYEKQRRNAKNEGISGDQLAFIFAKLSECIDTDADIANKKLLQASSADSAEAKDAQKPKAQPPRRRALPSNAAVVENTISVPSETRACPSCGSDRICIGHDVTEVIDIEPARVIIRKDRREKLACKSCEAEIVRAPVGDKVVAGGAYGSQLVADLVVSKYDDGLPLERQKQRLARLGLDMPGSSMGDQITWAAELLAPVARRLFEQTLDADIMHVDGTSIPVLDKDSPNGIKNGALWGYVGIDVHMRDGARNDALVATYLYTSTAKKNGQEAEELGPEDVLAMRKRRGKVHVVADAANLFDLSFSPQGGLTEVGCNMHARRYFAKALDAGDERAALALGAFKKIYDIEEEIRGKAPDDVGRERHARTRQVYSELLSWCDTFKRTEPPKSLLGAALGYITNHRVALTRFLDDGKLPIDNGVVERLHRRPAIGRRNYLFAGSDAGAHRAAIAYTVLGTCRLIGANQIAYLADVLPVLARGISIAHDLASLTPAAWLAAH